MELRRLEKAARADGLITYKNGTQIPEVTDAIEAFLDADRPHFILMNHPTPAQVGTLVQLPKAAGMELTVDVVPEASVLACLPRMRTFELMLDEGGSGTLDLRPLTLGKQLDRVVLRGAKTLGLTSFLKRHRAITALALTKTDPPEPEGLRVLERLHMLSLADMPQVDLSVLKGMPWVQDLRLTRVGIDDYGFFSGMKELGHVELVDMSDALPHVCDAPGLSTIEITGGSGELGPLARCGTLAQVHVRHTELSSVAPLRGFERMWVLDVSNNPRLTGVAPLAAATGLSTLYLQGTSVRSTRPLLELPSLDEVILPRQMPDAQVDALRRAHPRAEISKQRGYSRDG